MMHSRSPQVISAMHLDGPDGPTLNGNERTCCIVRPVSWSHDGRVLKQAQQLMPRQRAPRLRAYEADFQHEWACRIDDSLGPSVVSLTRCSDARRRVGLKNTALGLTSVLASSKGDRYALAKPSSQRLRLPTLPEQIRSLRERLPLARTYLCICWGRH